MTEKTTPAEPDLVLARATVSMQGLKAGQTATVDRSTPYIQMLFEREILVLAE